MHSLPLSRIAASLALLAAGHAFAACTANPILLPIHLRVGADTQHCQYNDIQSAIDAVGECPTIIDITREHTYTQQHLAIADKPHLTMQGWGDGVTCADIRNTLSFPPYAPPDSTAPLLTVSGSSDGLGSVLYVTGATNLALRNLTISGGQACADCSGGGIYFSGAGSLYLTRSTVSFNEAGYGAGIDVDGSGGPATLTLDSDTLVLSNTADTSGGGVRVEGDTRLYALSANTLIAFNHAPNGYGGGVEILSPARADIGSPGYNGLGVVYENQAQYGGGIAALGVSNPDNDGATIRLFTTDAAKPVQVSGNTASARGGAIYLKPYTQHVPAESASAGACAFDFRIDDNISAEGAAVYADFDSDISGRNVGSSLALNQTDACGPEAPTALGAVACAPGVACNEMSGNTAEDASNQPTDGAVVLVDSTASLRANRLILRNNAAGYAINAVGADDSGFGPVVIANCLLADNHTRHELVGIRRSEATSFSMGRCTLANNTIDNGYVFYANQNTTFSLANSIVDSPGVQTLDYTGAPANLGVAYVLSNDTSTLPATSDIDQGEPVFVDAAHGDYHLQADSPGVDFAPAISGLDLDRKTRTVDLPSVPNHFGPMDLGAYEIQRACSRDDTVFCDGFDGQ